MQPHVRPVIEQFLARFDQVADGSLSVVLYGSAARNEHVSGHSDLNLLVIAPAFPPSALEALGRVFQPLKGFSATPPLLFAEAEWRRSADVFPIEITDMQVAREVLRGPDPVAGLKVARHDLRRALERELRGKLLRLRQGYAVLARSDEDLTRLGVRSSATLAALVRASLAMVGETPPVSTREMIRRAGPRMGIDTAPVLRYYVLREAEDSSPGRADFERYLEATEALVRFIDQFHIGGD